MNSDELEMVPDVVDRLVRVLHASAADVVAREPTEAHDLGHSPAARELAHHTTLARHHLAGRLEENRSRLSHCGTSLAGFGVGVREADEVLAARLTALARGLT